MQKVELIDKKDKEMTWQIFCEYQKEWAQFDETVKFDKNETPIYLWFGEYWIDSGRWPFFLTIKNEIAGLCFIRKIEDEFSIAEFYIKPEYRKDNNALTFANMVINLFDGKITFSTTNKNLRALKFWQKFYNQFDCKKKTWVDETRTHWVLEKSQKNLACK